jgi:hypothetical protein
MSVSEFKLLIIIPTIVEDEFDEGYNLNAKVTQWWLL